MKDCSDCGFPTDAINENTLRKGSSVREPGEMLCQGCSSTRVMLVRQLDKIPNTLDQIRALRAPKIGRVA